MVKEAEVADLENQTEDTTLPEEEKPSDDQEEPEELVPPNVEQALKTIFDACKEEDLPIRLRYLSIWRKLQLYAEGIFDLYWDDVARDWRSFNWDDDQDEDMNSYNRNINIFRGHMESVIAALSVKVPGVNFIPDDADDPLDIETAEGMTDVVELIKKHNKSPLLIMKCLFILWTQGTCCAYNRFRTDPKYGTIEIPQTRQDKILKYKVYCLNCGNQIAELKETKPVEPIKCENCGLTEVPEVTEDEDTVERIVGYSNQPKGREVFDFWGPVNVKIPFWARNQESVGYLIFQDDVHYAMMKNEFEEYADDISEGSPSEDAHERYFRLLPEYVGNIPRFLNTMSAIWIRPWMYWTIQDEETRDYMFEKFPKGCFYCYAGTKLVGVENANLDDHWTISVDPLSVFIHGFPLGQPLTPIQEMRNDIVSLAFQSIEYSIPENFADPKVLDFQKYKDQQALPGMFTPIIKLPNSGQLADAFFQTTPSRLSEEVQVFTENIDRDGQFVTHDFPSVYGGPSEGSKTAFEYGKSNSAALQALRMSWARLVDLWMNTLAKSATQYVENMRGDEKYVKKESGKYINVWIRKQNLSGKIGDIEPDGSENLPLSIEQQWQLITSVLQMKDPILNQTILSPENAELLKKTSGIRDLYIPGDNDRRKQLGEIYDIINEDPSVVVDHDVDDHQVHMRIVKYYLTSDRGVYLYKTNPAAYNKIIEHYREHETALSGNTAAPGATPQGQPPKSSEPNIPA